MKKTLVALAALSALSAFAQSSVTISGTIDPSIATSNTTYGDGASVSNTFVRSGSQATSHVAFTGVEDLGGGLKATFRYEGDFSPAMAAGPTNSLGFAGGDIFVGLEGGWGAVKLGTPNTPSLSVQAARNPVGGVRLGSGFGGVMGTAHVRENGSIRYDTPNFGGFMGVVYYTFGTSATQPAQGGLAQVNAKTDIGLFYNNGPISAGLSFYNQDSVNSQTNLAASYNFGVAKVYLGYHTEDKKPGASRGYNIGADYNVSPALVVYGNYGMLDDETVANQDRKIVAIGAKYSLSKRTSVYTRYVNEANENVAAAAAIRSVNTFLVGVQHNF